MTLFGPEPEPEPEPERHYARILNACGLTYWPLRTEERQRVGRLAGRLRANGIAEQKIIEEGARLRRALGRRPTLSELADRLLP